MTNKRFHRDEYPFDILGEFGLTENMIYDLPDYVDTKIRANTEYANRKEFGKKCLINIANAGKFSSDRTILQYAKEIWHTSYKK